MFDVGFSELIVIGIVALVVIGPERLPKVARTAGHLFGRFQRYVSNVKADIQREMDIADLGKLKNEVQDAARSIQETVNLNAESLEFEARALKDSVDNYSTTDSPMNPAPNLSEPQIGASVLPDTIPAVLPEQQQLDLPIDLPHPSSVAPKNPSR